RRLYGEPRRSWDANLATVEVRGYVGVQEEGLGPGCRCGHPGREVNGIHTLQTSQDPYLEVAICDLKTSAKRVWRTGSGFGAVPLRGGDGGTQRGHGSRRTRQDIRSIPIERQPRSSAWRRWT